MVELVGSQKTHPSARLTTLGRYLSRPGRSFDASATAATQDANSCTQCSRTLPAQFGCSDVF